MPNTESSRPQPDYEAMWEDCRKHRDQAEKRARRYMEIIAQIADLVSEDDDPDADA